MATLTIRQQEILDFIISEIKLKGYPPSVREICAEVGLSSTSTVHAHLTRLEEKGIIRKDPTKPRTLEIIHPEYMISRVPGMIDVPIVSKIDTKTPIEKYTEGFFKLSSEVVGTDTVFMLRVNHEDFKPIAILKGDLVIVKALSNVVEGDLVVSVAGAGDCKIKAFNTGDKVIGKVVGVLRMKL